MESAPALHDTVLAYHREPMPDPGTTLRFLFTPLALLAAGWLSAGGQTDAAGLAFEPCRLEHRSRLISIEAQCATLRVAENAAVPGGQVIDLFVAKVPAISGRKSPDPVVLIAGGPGMGSSDMYPGVAQAFARIRRDRDLIIIDQRGTGRSSPLNCEASSELDGDLVSFIADSRRCLEVLRTRADLTQYTTSVAVQDLEALRRALGVAQWNLYGVSYGTRVAQHYLRRFPAQTRSVILDGVVPPGLALGPDIALDAEAALERILARCRRDEACFTRFGDSRERFVALRARLATPVSLTLPDPRSGEPRTLSFGRPQLGAVLRLQSYSSATASLLPLALHEAVERNNLAPLAGMFLMSMANLADVMAAGMHHSVVCAEDVPFIDATRLDRARLEATYLGAEQVDGLQAVCGFWPRGRLDADFREPLRSKVPVLMLSGADDPVTPPGNAVRAMRGLSNVRHLVLPGQGHGQIGVTCMNRVLAMFMQDLAPAALNARCLDAARPPPFFTTLAGPAP
jgi:pimeloyl-ACP methyl ester carboxylesterase